ncbi:hypothetical protein [Cryobacterium sp. PH31-O1]|uniref:hypothetical protein n=1 Tax=Cryobacterium sp. PH31-O1 TaxID=3046306 RepID=UPI0024B9F9FE|nr:hypothetical protein [Cryobacterium sp. PH31-O1]MDJ0337474.1 hypothetical protein [Cryobacterium sp. PH31-O1]
MTQFIINGLTAIEGESGMPPGQLYFNDLGDWYTGAESKTDVHERDQADGANEIESDWRASAVFTFTGWYEGETWTDVLRMIDAFNRAVVRRRLGPVTVTDELGSTSRIVSVRSSPVHEDKFSKSFTFAIDMLAPDPLRYGPAVSVSTGLPTSGGGLAYPVTYPVGYGAAGNPGRVVAMNPGTAETFSLLEVTGGMSGGFELTEISTGRVNRFVRPVPVGSTVVLNLRTGRALLDGPSDVTQYWTRQERWSVPAFDSRTVQIAALGVVTGTPTLMARTAPAYW